MASPHHWLAVRGGRIAVSGRPGNGAFAALAAEGCTHVVTLLAEKERARDVGERVERAGLTWLWLPLENGHPPPSARDGEFATALAQIRDCLESGASVLIHCAAGIHRTGMVTHALLRWCGLDALAAREALHTLRALTATGVGERRLAWAEELLARVKRTSRRASDTDDERDDGAPRPRRASWPRDDERSDRESGQPR